MFQEVLMLMVSLLRDFAVSSAILRAAKSGEEPRSWGMGSCRWSNRSFIHLKEKVRQGDVTFRAG